MFENQFESPDPSYESPDHIISLEANDSLTSHHEHSDNEIWTGIVN